MKPDGPRGWRTSELWLKVCAIACLTYLAATGRADAETVLAIGGLAGAYGAERFKLKIKDGN